MSTSISVSSGLTVGAAATTSVGMTVGYVVWVLRSGRLLSSVMAHLPMWRFMDPLAILDSSESHADEDEETLGSIADGDPSSDSFSSPGCNCRWGSAQPVVYSSGCISAEL